MYIFLIRGFTEKLNKYSLYSLSIFIIYKHLVSLLKLGMKSENTSERILVKRQRESDTEKVYNSNLIKEDFVLNHKYYGNSFYPINAIPNYRQMIYRYISMISNKINKKWLYLHFLLKMDNTNIKPNKKQNIIFQLPYEYNFFLEPYNNYIHSIPCTFCNHQDDFCKECGGLEINPSYDISCLTDESCKCLNMTENEYCPFHRILKSKCMKTRVVRCAPYSQLFTPEIESKKRYEYENPNAYRILLESDLFVCVTESFETDEFFRASMQYKNIAIDDLYMTIYDIVKLFKLTK